MKRVRRMVACAAVFAASMVAFAAPAAADTAVHGTVSWDVVHATSGQVTLYGQTQYQAVQVPLVIDPSGLSASYTANVTVPDDYAMFVVLGDCPDAATGNAYLCPEFMYLSGNTITTVTGATMELDLAPPAGFGPVAASGTATLSGAPAVGGTVQFYYSASDASSSIFGSAMVSIDGSGHYAATVGSGSVGVDVQPIQASCVANQTLFLFNSADNVAAGSTITLDTSGDGLPPAPPPGAIHVDFGVAGVPDAIGRFFTNPTFETEDCAGGWNAPELWDVPAGSYLMASSFSGSTSISPGTYTPDVSFSRPTDPSVQAGYQYPDRAITVAPGQTAEADYRFSAAFLNVKAPIDWNQFGALDPYNSSDLQFAAYSSAPAGSQLGAGSTYSIFAGGGVQSYTFQMPIDPALHWTFYGVTFAIYSADGTFKNIGLVPGLYTVNGTPSPVPPLSAGQSTSYDFTALAKLGVGHVEYAPRALPAYGPYINGNGSQVVPGQGIQLEYVFYSTPYGSPSATFTVMPGQQTLTASWYDPNFNILSDSLNLDIRPNESVSLSDSAPHLDNVQPAPGNVCVATFKVTGVATDPDRVAGVTVNGVEADVKDDGSFSRSIKIPVGDSTIVVRATDRNGAVIVRSRPVHRNADNSGCN
jgi:hypothetical protein